MADDQTGYCKPPKKHRFQKGQSGNYAGRPRKVKAAPTNDEGEIIRRLDAETLQVGGKSMNRREAELRKIRDLSFSGNRSATRLLSVLRAKMTAQSGGGVLHKPASYFLGETDDEE